MHRISTWSPFADRTADRLSNTNGWQNRWKTCCILLLWAASSGGGGRSHGFIYIGWHSVGSRSWDQSKRLPVCQWPFTEEWRPSPYTNNKREPTSQSEEQKNSARSFPQGIEAGRQGLIAEPRQTDYNDHLHITSRRRPCQSNSFKTHPENDKQGAFKPPHSLSPSLFSLCSTRRCVFFTRIKESKQIMTKKQNKKNACAFIWKGICIKLLCSAPSKDTRTRLPAMEVIRWCCWRSKLPTRARNREETLRVKQSVQLLQQRAISAGQLTSPKHCCPAHC